MLQKGDGGDANNNAVSTARCERLETVAVTPNIPTPDRTMPVALARLLALLALARVRRQR